MSTEESKALLRRAYEALLLWVHGGRDARPAQIMNGDQARSREPRCREGAASATIPSVRPLTMPS